MDKCEVLHIFRVCFLAYLHAEVGSAERDLFEGLTYNWQKYAEARGWYEEVATIIKDLFIVEEK